MHPFGAHLVKKCDKLWKCTQKCKLKEPSQFLIMMHTVIAHTRISHSSPLILTVCLCEQLNKLNPSKFLVEAKRD